MCEPVAIAGTSGAVPSKRAKVLPTLSARMLNPAASHNEAT